MSEQKERFMQELDKWTQQVVIKPIWKKAQEGDQPDEVESVFEDVKKAIRERVFDSYRAGCRATEDKLGVKSRKRREKED